MRIGVAVGVYAVASIIEAKSLDGNVPTVVAPPYMVVVGGFIVKVCIPYIRITAHEVAHIFGSRCVGIGFLQNMMGKGQA